MTTEPLAPPTFRDYLRILLRRWWVVVLGIVGFTGLLVAYSYKGPTIYTSTSEVRFETGVDTSAGSTSAASHTSTGSQNTSLLTQVEVLKAARFQDLVKKQNHLGPNAIKQLNVGQVTGTNAINITVGMSNKNNAAFIANQYAQSFVATVQLEQAHLVAARSATTQRQVNTLTSRVNSLQDQIGAEARRIDAADVILAAQGKQALRSSALLVSLQSQLDQIVPTYNALLQANFTLQAQNAAAAPAVEQISDATASSTPIQPAPVKYGIVGFVLGLIMGIAGAFVFELLTDKVRTRQDVERFSGLPVLATVPARGPKDMPTKPVTLAAPTSARAEAYRAARAGVQFLSVQAPMRRILVTGLREKDRSDSAAANLAVTLAAAGARVVLVDADLRDGQLHERFGLTRGNGLTSVLLGDTPLADALRPVEVPGGALRVLATGPLPPNPADLLASDPLAQVFAKLADGADFVVVSAPPLLPYNDALTLSQHADGVIVVATARRTRRRQLADGVSKLGRVDAHAVGVLLDRAGRGTDSYEPTVGQLRARQGHASRTESEPAEPRQD
jgi:capsular exopolysaccharide synthesis family protein